MYKCVTDSWGKGRSENHLPCITISILVSDHSMTYPGDTRTEETETFSNMEKHSFGTRPVFENRLTCLLANVLNGFKCQFSHL